MTTFSASPSPVFPPTSTPSPSKAYDHFLSLVSSPFHTSSVSSSYTFQNIITFSSSNLSSLYPSCVSSSFTFQYIRSHSLPHIHPLLSHPCPFPLYVSIDMISFSVSPFPLSSLLRLLPPLLSVRVPRRLHFLHWVILFYTGSREVFGGCSVGHRRCAVYTLSEIKL